MTEPGRRQDGTRVALRHLPGALLLTLMGAGALALVWFIDDLVQHTDRVAPYYRSPDFFPRMSLLIAGIGGLAMAVRHLRHGAGRSDEALPRTRPRLPLVLAMGAAFAGYTVLVPWVGYPLATALFVSTGLVLAGRRPLSALLFAVTLAALLWLVFAHLLGVWFPAPRLLTGA